MEVDQLPTDLPPHPRPLPNPHHRKIELQSPLDLTYLRDNIATAARQKLDLHFPSDAASRNRTGSSEKRDGAVPKEDPMRARVAALLDQFLDRTFDYAGGSISINGNDLATASSNIFPSATPNSNTNAPQPRTAITTASTSQSQLHQEAEREGIHFSYEAYDPRLSTKLASLYAELERETLAVSQLRRTAPAEGARAGGEALLTRIKEDGEKGPREIGEGEAELKLEALPDGWREDVAEMYEHGLGDLRRLAGAAGAGDTLRRGRVGEDGITWAGGSLTETVGKVQRARDVAMEFE